jgi:hypothetical protein
MAWGSPDSLADCAQVRRRDAAYLTRLRERATMPVRIQLAATQLQYARLDAELTGSALFGWTHAGAGAVAHHSNPLDTAPVLLRPQDSKHLLDLSNTKCKILGEY